MIFNDIGFGAPHIKVIWDSPEGPKELQERITDFEYQFTDDDGDRCRVVIKSDIATLPDNKEYQELAKWKISWGYIKGKFSEIRTVVVRDVVSMYDKEGLTLTVKLTDRASYIKQKASRKVYANATALDIAKDVAANNDLDLAVDDGKETTKITPAVYSNNRVEGYANNALPGTGSTFATSNTFTKRPIIEEQFVKQESNVQGNKNDFATLKNALSKDPTGPWNIDNRDETITIRKRNLNKKPIGTYYYRHDEGTLLNFTPETKNETQGNSATELSTGVWDSLNKAYSEVSALQNLDLGEGLMGDNTQKKDFVDGSTRTYTNIGYGESGQYWKPATENTSIIIIGEEDKFQKTEKTDDAIINNPEGAGGLGPGLSQLANNRRNQALQKNPAKCLVVGNPLLKSSEVLTFLGLAKKFSGNYYICKATHRITIHDGYKTDLELLRNSTGKTGNDPEWLVDGNEYGLSKNKQVGDFDTIKENKEVTTINANEPTK